LGHELLAALYLSYAACEQLGLLSTITVELTWCLNRLWIDSIWKKNLQRLFFSRFLPVFSEPWNRSEKGGAELVPPFCLYRSSRALKVEEILKFGLIDVW